MERTGTLRVVSGISRLEGWRRLARGGSDPLGAATDFLAERGFDDGDFITVTGELGTLADGTPVCFISAAVMATPVIAAFTNSTKGSKKRSVTSKRTAKKTRQRKRHPKTSVQKISPKRTTKTAPKK